METSKQLCALLMRITFQEQGTIESFSEVLDIAFASRWLGQDVDPIKMALRDLYDDLRFYSLSKAPDTDPAIVELYNTLIVRNGHVLEDIYETLDNWKVFARPGRSLDGYPSLLSVLTAGLFGAATETSLNVSPVAPQEIVEEGEYTISSEAARFIRVLFIDTPENELPVRFTTALKRAFGEKAVEKDISKIKKQLAKGLKSLERIENYEGPGQDPKAGSKLVTLYEDFFLTVYVVEDIRDAFEKWGIETE